MKNPERAAELLAELRELADNDFERHRIDVLERDLTEPPQVEIIDDTHQKFDGTIYKKHHGRYFTSNTCIHRAVWIYCYGEIPDNYEIHHADKDPSNNELENLHCLSRSEHASLHSSRVGTEKKCRICGKVFTSKGYKAYYCSSKCAHFSTTYTKLCKRCGKNFTTTKKEAEYCSTTCANRDIIARIKTERVCVFCNKEFIGCGRFCSKTCARKFYKNNVPTEERTCVVCQKKFFVSKDSKRKTCSGTCSSLLNWQHRRESNAISENSDVSHSPV